MFINVVTKAKKSKHKKNPLKIASGYSKDFF